MRKGAVCLIAVSLAVASVSPVWAAAQAPRLEGITPQQSQAAGMSLLAAATNLVYFPLRLALTTATATVGGLAAWMTGGDQRSAQAVWDSTDGQAFITPAILDGHESLHFGRPASAW